MVIIDDLKTVFVEVPRTGTNSISNELRKSHNGKLHGAKHSFKIPEYAQNYNVIYGTGNPVEREYSKYIKYKTRPTKYFINAGSFYLVRVFSFIYNMTIVFFVRRFKMSYYSYLLFTNILPYVDPNNFIRTNGKKYLIRKENLNDDFRKVMEKLGVSNVNDLGRANITKGKENDFTIDLESSIIKWKFNYELKRQGYTYNDFNTKTIAFLNTIMYKINYYFKFTLWRIARG